MGFLAGIIAFMAGIPLWLLSLTVLDSGAGPRHEAHVGSGDGFADGSGIRRVVLAALAAHAVRGDELGGDQPDGVAVLPEQPRPVVGAGTRFHADQGRRQLRDQRRQILPRHLRLDQQQIAIIINGVHRKYILGEVDSYRDPTAIRFGHNAHGLPLPWF